MTPTVHRETIVLISVRWDEAQYLHSPRCQQVCQAEGRPLYICNHLEALHIMSDEDSEGNLQCAVCICKEFKGDEEDDDGLPA